MKRVTHAYYFYNDKYYRQLKCIFIFQGFDKAKAYIASQGEVYNTPYKNTVIETLHIATL